MKRFSVIAVILLNIAGCFAQFSDKELYAAYLNQDMSVWGQYIKQADFDGADSKEKQRILNYSYGYIAYAVSEKTPDAQQLLEEYKKRLDLVEGSMVQAEKLTYLSAYYAYAINYNKMKLFAYGKESISLSEKAVLADKNNPIALSLRGNILFYSPKLFGGNKEEALKMFLQAQHQYIVQGQTENNWNYRALQLTIAQCYEKTGNKQRAIESCRKTLQEEPDFVYIRDYYLPKLEGKEPKGNGEDVTGKLSNMILN